MTPQRKYLSMKRHRKPIFGSAIMIPKKSCSCLFAPSMIKPAAAFWGDKDGDGVYNGLDCEPSNKKKQGPQHIHSVIKMNTDFMDKKIGTLKRQVKDIDDQSERYMHSKGKIADAISDINRRHVARKSRYANELDRESDSYTAKMSRYADSADRASAAHVLRRQKIADSADEASLDYIDRKWGKLSPKQRQIADQDMSTY